MWLPSQKRPSAAHKFTKDARAMAAIGNKINERTSVRFTVEEFDCLVAQIAKDVRRRKHTLPLTTIPPIKKSGGQPRELPLADSALLEAISRYVDERMALKKPPDRRYCSGVGFYSPNKYAVGLYGHDAAEWPVSILPVVIPGAHAGNQLTA